MNKACQLISEAFELSINVNGTEHCIEFLRMRVQVPLLRFVLIKSSPIKDEENGETIYPFLLEQQMHLKL